MASAHNTPAGAADWKLEESSRSIENTVFYLIVGFVVFPFLSMVTLQLLLRNSHWLCSCCNRHIRRYPFETPQHAQDRRANTGLKRNEIQALPVMVFSSGTATSDDHHHHHTTEDSMETAGDEEQCPSIDPQCPICLNDFTDGQLIRKLPSCQHGFHVSCIDPWLSKHSSCPNCRDDVLTTLRESRSSQVHVHIVVDAQEGSVSSTLCRLATTLALP